MSHHHHYHTPRCWLCDLMKLLGSNSSAPTHRFSRKVLCLTLLSSSFGCLASCAIFTMCCPFFHNPESFLAYLTSVSTPCQIMHINDAFQEVFISPNIISQVHAVKTYCLRRCRAIFEATQQGILFPRGRLALLSSCSTFYEPISWVCPFLCTCTWLFFFTLCLVNTSSSMSSASCDQILSISR